MAAPNNLSNSDWSSIQKEHLRHKQAALAVEGGWRARNYRQNWSANFDGRGFEVTPEHGTWRWGLKLISYGRPGQQRVVSAPKPAADVEKFSYQWDSILREWYINGEGLEHGYTLAARPGQGSGLEFHLEVHGTLEAQVGTDGRNVAFSERPGGPPMVKYSGLKVTDATGRELEARFYGEDKGLRLEIDDSAAQYPITVDPIAQEAYLKASHPDAADQFGYSVAMDGNFVVVGAPNEDSNGSSPTDNSLVESGAAFVFLRLASGAWTQVGYLKASNRATRDYFGYSVAISGNTVVVGAWGKSLNGGSGGSAGQGAAYVFRFVPGIGGMAATWAAEASLRAGNAAFGDHFCIVAISGDTIVVGAPNQGSGDGSFDAGAAYLFTRSLSTGSPVWTQAWYFTDPLHLPNQNFGQSVAISGNTVVAGVPSAFLPPSFGARAYVYTGTGGVWTQQAALVASNQDPTIDLFGNSVSIDGDTIVVGAPSERGNGSSPTDNSLPSAGAAYVYTRSTGVWTEQKYLKAPSPVGFEQFGYSVGVSGNIVAVGAPTVNNFGSTYVFSRDPIGVWSLEGRASASNQDGGDQFGFSVGVSGNLVVAGAYRESSDGSSPANNSAPSAGAAYVYVVQPTINVTVNTSPQGLQFATVGAGCVPPPVNTFYTAPRTLAWTAPSCVIAVPANQGTLLFTHWEDGSTANPRTITGPPSATYTAFFGATVTVIVTPSAAGHVTGPNNITCADTCSFTLDASQSPASFSAVPNGTFTFAGWSGGCTAVPCAVTIDRDRTITATFNSPPLTVGITLTTQPPQRVISTSRSGCAPGTFTTPIALQWTPGASCVLSVESPQSLLVFTHWEDGSTANPRSVTAPASTTTYTAFFGATVTMFVTPQGGGTVTGPGNSVCLTTCNYISDAIPGPTFTASPSPGFNFSGWN
ncbi:MAG: hypothetical protein ABI806_01995, partial [Candidatus Solibacter sp.]